MCVWMRFLILIVEVRWFLRMLFLWGVSGWTWLPCLMGYEVGVVVVVCCWCRFLRSWLKKKVVGFEVMEKLMYYLVDLGFSASCIYWRFYRVWVIAIKKTIIINVYLSNRSLLRCCVVHIFGDFWILEHKWT